jgi:ComF family protein
MRGFLTHLLPNTCALCGRLQAALVCAGCEADLLTPRHRCLQCALTLADLAAPRCGACLRRPPPHDRAVTLGDYAEPLDTLVKAFKFHARLPLAGWFAARLAQALPADAPPDLLLPVPLSSVRLRERGYNQAWELAWRMGRQLGRPARVDLLQRQRDTASQAGLSLRARRANLRHAFALRDSAGIRGKHIALIDDVMTSGATMAEIGHLLKRHGAARITAVAALRTPPAAG